ncbi:MAG: hypothetical protein RBS57_20460 [Desulforhabdus sp.]|jgi:hypothetical protein|nr:hypothetical protein [Desulforhabdus sp.]
MIERCGEPGLPPLNFEERAGQFVATIWRDWLTDEVMAPFELKDRQLKTIAFN